MKSQASKARWQSQSGASSSAGDDDVYASADPDEPSPGLDAGEDAGESAPPPRRELSLMAFLLSNEHDAALDSMLGEFLPREVFSHDFTWGFVEAWRTGVASGEDAIAMFAERL